MATLRAWKEGQLADDHRVRQKNLRRIPFPTSGRARDANFSCAKFLWATWKAHDTMALYVRHQFYEHPSIAAVLARHLADNHVKPDAASGTKITNLEKAIRNINARLDTTNSNLDSLDTKTDSLKDSVKDLKADIKDIKGSDRRGKYKKPKDKNDKPDQDE